MTISTERYHPHIIARAFVSAMMRLGWPGFPATDTRQGLDHHHMRQPQLAVIAGEIFKALL